MSNPKNDKVVYGKAISREQAEAYIKNFEDLKKAAVVSVSPAQTTADAKTRATPAKATKFEHQVHNLLDSNYNAFVFAKEEVDRFFTGGAEYLMVLLGAKLDTGYPTIVLVGCNKKDDHFYSLDIADPATEQPPKFFESQIPPNGDAKKNGHWTFCEQNGKVS